MMTKEQFLEIFLAKYQDINQLNKIKDFYQYEKMFDQSTSCDLLSNY